MVIVNTSGRVLITGADGRIGTQLVPSLQNDGWETIAMRRGAEPGVSVDLLDSRAVSSLLRTTRPDVVVHLAAQRSGTGLENRNYVGLMNLLDAVDEVRVSRFVFASSGAVYGTHAQSARAETSPTNPETEYARSKLQCEDALMEFGRRRSWFRATILRIFNVVGRGFDESLVSRLLRSDGEAPTPLLGWEGFVRDYVHVDDVCRAVSMALHRKGELDLFNVGSGRPISNRELIRRLSSFGALEYRVEGDATSWNWADTTRSRRFGWSPAPRDFWQRDRLELC